MDMMPIVKWHQHHMDYPGPKLKIALTQVHQVTVNQIQYAITVITVSYDNYLRFSAYINT